MLKALALTLAVATLLASGFTLAPAQPVAPVPISVSQSAVLTSEHLLIVPLEDQVAAASKTDRPAKTDRQPIPNS